MKYRLPTKKAQSKQGGYALLLVVFFTALVVVATMSAGLRILTEGKREKEQEMIWRGKQYTRAIRAYYRKLGRFPNSMDDLTKPKVGSLRFLRQPYKDPMNKEDGSWRLIYVGPAGNLIGSLKPRPPGGIQMPVAGGAAGGQQGALGSPPSAGGGIPGFGSTAGTPPSGPGSTGTAPTTGGTGTPGTPDTSGTGTGPDSQPVPPADTPTIVGGNIIGVGSKIDERSVIVYEQAHNYRLFEFIWDPSKDMGVVSSGPAPAVGTPAGAPGTTPGAFPINPLNPPPTPPTAAPPPNPSQP